MASPQNASLGKHANDFWEGYSESTLGTQDCKIHINLAITSINAEAGC